MWIRRNSRCSFFCRTRSKIDPARISVGVKSVPRNKWLNSSALCVNASSPNSSFETQQKASLNRLSHNLVTFLCMSSWCSFGSMLSLSSLIFRYFRAPVKRKKNYCDLQKSKMECEVYPADRRKWWSRIWSNIIRSSRRLRRL